MIVTKKITLDDLECGECGFVFAVPDNWLADRKQTGELFHCPVGHTIGYGKNENKRLKERVEALQSQLTHAQDQRIAAEKDAQAARAEAERQRKRAANGVCPCCNRTFANLGRHMRGQHPDYAEATHAPEVKR